MSRTPLPTVQALLAGRGPSAIPRLVMAVVVDAVKASAFRLCAHIGEEVFKLQPPLAHGDPATTPVAIVSGARIQATRFHAAPREIFRRFPVCGVAVRRESFQQEFAPEATTASRAAGSEARSVNRNSYSAIALTQPARLLGRSRSSMQYNQAAESQIRQIDQAHSQFYHWEQAI